MTSYDDILNSMIEKYEQLSGVKLNDESDIMLRFMALAGELYNAYSATDFIKRQMFVSTATGEYLDKHAVARGLERKEAKKSKGEVTFSVSKALGADIVIQKGTIVATAGVDSKQFETDEAVTLKSGSLNVSAKATAISGGADYNVLKSEVSVMVTPVSGIEKVTNALAFRDGADKESDDKLRDRVLYSYKDIPNGTNAVYYKRLAESVDSVYSACVASKARGEGTVDVYVRSKGSSLLSSDTLDKVQKLLDENRELNVDIIVENALPIEVSFTVNVAVKDGYSFDIVKENITQRVKAYMDLLGVGESALLCELGEIIYHTEGVSNYSFLDAFCADVHPAKNKYCVLAGLDIKAVEQ